MKTFVKYFSITILIVLFISCNINYKVEINTMNVFPDWVKEFENKNDYPMLIPAQIQVDKRRELRQWNAERFADVGMLSNRWKKYIDKECFKIPSAFAYPNSWHIGGCYFIDPYTGNLPETFKYDMKDIPTPGITDGEYIFGYYWHKGTDAGCWRLSDCALVWKNFLGLTDVAKFSIIGQYLIHSDIIMPRIARLNPRTGEVIWCNYSKKQASGFTHNNKYAFMILKDSSNIFEIDRINPEDGKADVVLSSENEIKDIATIDNSLWVVFETGELFNFDGESFKQLYSINVGNLNKLKPIGNKLLLSNIDENKYSLFDPTTETITPLDTPSAKVINNSLIFEDYMQLRGIDPETLQTTWWIDLDENMKNAHVEWLDWRGVLVVSDNEIACYAPKK